VNGITVRFELFQMFGEMLHGFGIGLFLKRRGSFVVVHNFNSNRFAEVLTIRFVARVICPGAHGRFEFAALNQAVDAEISTPSISAASCTE